MAPSAGWRPNHWRVEPLNRLSNIIIFCSVNVSLGLQHCGLIPHSNCGHTTTIVDVGWCRMMYPQRLSHSPIGFSSFESIELFGPSSSSVFDDLFRLRHYYFVRQTLWNASNATSELRVYLIYNLLWYST